MPLDRAVMDFHKVGLVDTPEGQRLRVIVVVTEREGVDRPARHAAPRRPQARGHRPVGLLRHPRLNHLDAQPRARSCTRSSAISSTSRSPKQACAGSLGRRRRAWRWCSGGWPRTAGSQSRGPRAPARRRRRRPSRATATICRGRPAQADRDGARLRAARRGRVLLDPVRVRRRHRRCGRRPAGPASRVRRGAVGSVGAGAHLRRGHRRPAPTLSATSIPARARRHRAWRWERWTS